MIGIDFTTQRFLNLSIKFDLPLLSDFPVTENFKKYMKECLKSSLKYGVTTPGIYQNDGEVIVYGIKHYV